MSQYSLGADVQVAESLNLIFCSATATSLGSILQANISVRNPARRSLYVLWAVLAVFEGTAVRLANNMLINRDGTRET